jgi:hypothetical protein
MLFDIQGKALKVLGFKRFFKLNLEKPLKVFKDRLPNPLDILFIRKYDIFTYGYRMVQERIRAFL